MVEGQFNRLDVASSNLAFETKTVLRLLPLLKFVMLIERVTSVLEKQLIGSNPILSP